MFLIIEILFVLLLIAILVVLYRNERLVKRSRLPYADIEEFWDGKERRRHIRFKSALQVTYSLRDKRHIKNNCRTIDISDGGLKLMMNEKLSVGSLLHLKISIPRSKSSAEIEGEIVWSEDVAEKDTLGRRLFCSGLKFSAIKEPFGKHLIEYIHTLSEKSD
jgi:c-di-GMP-binding flagellar brake protein YcgR